MMNWQGVHPLMGQRYMVAAEHPLAVQAGLSILQAGGNAMDAAVAVATTSWVVMPDMCGPGGDIFILGSSQEEIWSLNGSGVCAHGATADFFLSRGHKEMPLDGILSVAIPGAVHGLLQAHEKYGSLPLSVLMKDAMEHAIKGFPISPRLFNSILDQRNKLNKYSQARALFFPHGLPLHVGQILYQPLLAKTLELLATDGLEGFYQGAIAEDFLTLSQQMEGLFLGEEWSSHTSEFAQPISIDYRGHTVYQTSPPSQGMITLQALGILEGYPLSEYGFSSPSSVHLMVESLKLSFQDRLQWAGDPKHIDFPLDTLISKDYLAQQRTKIHSQQAADGFLGHNTGDTTSFVIVDGAGNGISCIHSLSIPFGSGVMLPNWGILLNNRAGRGFNLKKGHPNCIAPGKRTMHTLNTWLITKGKQLWALGNTPGGDGQPQWNLQAISSLIDHKFNPQQAVSAPRWLQFPATDPHELAKPPILFLEEGIPKSTGEFLSKWGHDIRPWAGGGAIQLIQRQGQLLLGASDPRSEGLALGR